VVIFRGNEARAISLVSVLGTSLIMGLAIWIVRRGAVDVAGWLAILCMLVSLLAPIAFQRGNTTVLIYLAVPVVVSGLILRPWQVWLVALMGLALILGKTYSLSPEVLSDLLVTSTISGSTILLIILGAVSQLGAYNVRTSFRALDVASKAAEEAARHLEELNLGLEQQVQSRTAELQVAFSEADARANEKQTLLDEIAAQRTVIREMSIPVLPVREGTLVMPLIGDLDGGRLEMIQKRALTIVESYRAHTLLIDLTGVDLVDTQVARGLMQTVDATRLLGAKTVLIGIRPEVAQSIVSLGIDLGNVQTASNLASALS